MPTVADTARPSSTDYYKVQQTLDKWKRFTELPTEVKKDLPYSNNSRGVGYELKDGSGNKGDRKENFDISLGGKAWLEENIASIQHSVVLDFLEYANLLVLGVKSIIIDFAQDIEKEFGVVGLHNEVVNGTDAFFIRFIYYPADREIGEETATAHVDQGGFTLHLGESASGFQILTREGEWIDVPFSEEDTVVIPSMQMQLRSEGRLRATTHREVATAETTKLPRYSAVCFVGLKNTPSYDKEKWGRLQEMEPGFNYRLPFEEFKKYFRLL